MGLIPEEPWQRPPSVSEGRFPGPPGHPAFSFMLSGRQPGWGGAQRKEEAGAAVGAPGKTESHPQQPMAPIAWSLGASTGELRSFPGPRWLRCPAKKLFPV